MTKFNTEREADITKAISYYIQYLDKKVKGYSQIPRPLPSVQSMTCRPASTKLKRRRQ